MDVHASFDNRDPMPTCYYKTFQKYTGGWEHFDSELTVKQIAMSRDKFMEQPLQFHSTKKELALLQLIDTNNPCPLEGRIFMHVELLATNDLKQSTDADCATQCRRFSKRVQFLIQDLLDLKNSGWQKTRRC